MSKDRRRLDPEDRADTLKAALMQASAMLAELELALDYVSARNLLETDHD